MLRLDARTRQALGGGLGLVLLAFAFWVRWGAPPRGNEAARSGAQATAEIERAATAASGDHRPVAERHGSEPSEAPNTGGAHGAVEAEPETSLADVAPEVQAEVDDALNRARVALKAGRLIQPEKESALYWFQAALDADRANREARQGYDKVLAQIVDQAGAALDRGDAQPAEEVVKLLAGQKAGEAAAHGLGARIAAVATVQPLLRQGAERFAAGNIFQPEQGSALDSYRAALAADPANSAARQGLREVIAKMLEAALAAASDIRFEDADRLLSDARSLNLSGDDVDAAIARVGDMRRERAAGLLSRAQAALDARELDQAGELIVRARALGADAAAVAALDQRLADARIYDHASPGAVLSDPFRDLAGKAPDLVVIPLGEYAMGAPNGERGARGEEQPQHKVRIVRPFALGRTEVTVEQFRRFVNASSYSTSADRSGNSMVYDEGSGRLSERRGTNWRDNYIGSDARDDDPVIHVSYDDAVAYTTWLAERTGKAYRLPTEAEFEYALRGGQAGRFPWGDGGPPRNVGNLTGEQDQSDSGRRWNNAFPRYGDNYWGPAPVAKFKPNAFQLFDLEGNVSEWVEDCWHDSFLRAPDDGSAWVNKGCDRRVVRGGSWGSSPDQVRSAYRTPSPPDVRSARVGFRVARDL